MAADEHRAADQQDRRRAHPVDHREPQEPEPVDGLIRLQRLVGNRAVAGILTQTPLSGRTTGRLSLQRQTPRSGPPPIETHSSMPAIFMEYGSTTIRTSGGVDSMVHLMHALTKIRDYEKSQRRRRKPARIILHGSASADGAESRNVSLSKARAERIKLLLAEAGVTAAIDTIGHGAAGTFPDLASNRCVLIELVDEGP